MVSSLSSLEMLDADLLADPLVAEVLGVESSEGSLDAMVSMTLDDTSSDMGADADLLELADLGLIGDTTQEQQVASGGVAVDAGEVQSSLDTTDPVQDDDMLAA